MQTKLIGTLRPDMDHNFKGLILTSLKVSALWLATALFFPKTALSQILPKGVFALSMGTRHYLNSDNYYTKDGIAKNFGSRFNTDFIGPKMSTGELGGEFKKLYDGVVSATDKSIADQLDFGRLRGEVDVGIKAQFFGVGYGVSSRFSIYAGMPFVEANVKSQLRFEDGTNAINGKSPFQSSFYSSLYRSLKDQVKLDMTKIRSTIEKDLSYAPVDRWTYRGPSDLLIGTRYRLLAPNSRDRGAYVDSGLKLLIPTGHADDPDNLIDMPISRGYFQVSPALTAGYASNLFKVEVDATYGYGIPQSKKIRLPVNDEKLVPAERKTTVQLDPGDETSLKAQMTSNFSVLNVFLSQSYNRIYEDKYSGKSVGNYATLAIDSDRQSLSQELGFNLSSVSAFKRKKFPFPAIFTLSTTQTISGKNLPKLNYYELSLTTFLAHQG